MNVAAPETAESTAKARQARTTGEANGAACGSYTSRSAAPAR